MRGAVDTFPQPPRKTWLDRSLSLVTDVRAGEGVSALLLAANVFYLLAFYSVLKIVRDALILSEAGAVAASYASAGQALLLLGFIPVYSAFASRVNRVWLISGVTLFFASHLLIFCALGLAGVRIGIAFYLWIGVFNMVAVAQFWAFANDLYTNDRGKRLFPLVGVGATLGALAGSGLTAFAFGGIGPYNLMLVAAAGLLVPVALTIVVHRRESRAARAAEADAGVYPASAAASGVARQAPGAPDEPIGKRGGFELVLKNRYLLLIAMLVLASNLVNTLGNFILNVMIIEEAASVVAAGAAGGLDERALIGTIAGTVQTWVNLLAFLLQTFIVSRVFKYIGVRGALFVLPIIALGGYAAIAALPMLAVVRWSKTFENSTDYSIQNTTRHALFLPTSREAKYKAKQAIDSFFLRTGDMLSAAVVFAGTALAFTVRHYALLNLVVVAAWLAIAWAIAREHRKLVPAEIEDKAA
jgi:ATP:ADP antiporter, AAA family